MRCSVLYCRYLECVFTRLKKRKVASMLRLVTTESSLGIPQFAQVSRISLQRRLSLSQPACSSSCADLSVIVVDLMQHRGRRKALASRANFSVLIVDLMQHHGRRRPPCYLRQPHAEHLSTHVDSNRLYSVYECLARTAAH